MENIVIGIEGLVGAGKTSICRELINKIENTVMLNGGNLYRAIVYACLKSGKSIEEIEKELSGEDIKKVMDSFNIELKIENNETIVYINGEKASEEELQSKQSSLAVSKIGGIANNKNLFVFARNLIDELKEKHNVIISGRSIMAIYPKTNYHFFITATLEERIRRKCIQYENGSEQYDEVKKNIEERDALQEKAGFYKIEENTIVVDVTECKSIEESTNKVLAYII